MVACPVPLRWRLIISGSSFQHGWRADGARKKRPTTAYWQTKSGCGELPPAGWTTGGETEKENPPCLLSFSFGRINISSARYRINLHPASVPKQNLKRLLHECYSFCMSKVEEIERVVEQLPPEDFAALAAWIDQRRGAQVLRDHSAFLNSYSPQDEGLYDDVAAG